MPRKKQPDVAPQDAPPTAARATEAASGDGLQQFVTFYLDRECFAFPMEKVREIIRVPQSVAVPMSPDGSIGLANLRGTILPVMDLRTILGLARREPDEASRTIVVDCGRAVGLVVDRVARVAGFAGDRIEAPDASGATGPAGAGASGVVKDPDGAGLIQILDPLHLVRLHPVAGQTVPGEVSGEAAVAGDGAGEATDASVQLVSLSIDGQDYGFDIAEVDEIVRPPETAYQVPKAPSHLVGIINLRNRLLPIVSLRRIFALPDAPITDSNRILVIRLGDTRVGIVVDQVQEVMNVPLRDMVKTSGLIRGGDIDHIGTMCRLENGKRLMGVLSARTLLSDATMRAVLDAAAEGAGREEVTEVESIMSDNDIETEETQLVVYQLAGQEYGVEIAAVREIIRVPTTLNRVPKAPSHVAGLINIRGAVLPVVSMRLRFGLEEATESERRRIVVLSDGTTDTGFIVDSVTEVLRLPRSAIEDAPPLSEAQSRMIGKVANLSEGQRFIQILDAQYILQPPDAAEAA